MNRESELMMNFQEFLKFSLPFLRRASITVGSDEWDEFTELTFQSMVLLPIEEFSGSRLDWSYGTWLSRGNEPEIRVKIRGKGKILGATEDRSSLSNRFSYSELTPPDTPILFREFSHPLKDPSEGNDWLDYVEGEVSNEPPASHDRLDRVCIPLERCSFEVVQLRHHQ